MVVNPKTTRSQFGACPGIADVTMPPCCSPHTSQNVRGVCAKLGIPRVTHAATLILPFLFACTIAGCQQPFPPHWTQDGRELIQLGTYGDRAPGWFIKAVDRYGTLDVSKKPELTSSVNRVSQDKAALKAWLQAQPPGSSLKAIGDAMVVETMKYKLSFISYKPYDLVAAIEANAQAKAYLHRNNQTCVVTAVAVLFDHEKIEQIEANIEASAEVKLSMPATGGVKLTARSDSRTVEADGNILAYEIARPVWNGEKLESLRVDR